MVPCSLMSINSITMVQYLKYIADRLSMKLDDLMEEKFEKSIRGFERIKVIIPINFYRVLFSLYLYYQIIMK